MAVSRVVGSKNRALAGLQRQLTEPMAEAFLMADKSPKTIATINFKGGVSKTTVTWCLGDVLSSMSNQNVLMFDLDAQMSPNTSDRTE